MILEEWNKKAFVSAWIKATGEYGDFYRRTLINPILAGALDAEEADLEEGFFHHALTKFHLSEECPIVSTDSPRFEDLKCKQWMEAYPKNSGDSKVRILDLGCGEGYRGRWLAPKGYIYSGIDGSTEMIKYAKLKNRRGGDTQLHMLDLASEGGRKALVKCICSSSSLPKWHFAVTLFDLLRGIDLMALLQELTSSYDTQSTSYMVAVTCNPQFYRARPDQEQLAIAEIETLSSDGKSGQSCVRMFHRSRTFYSRVFRDSGIAVLDCVTPMPLVKSRYDTGHDRGTGPLTFWLLRIGGVRRTPLTLGKNRKLVDRFSGLRLQGAAGALLSQMDSNAECYELHVKSGQTIVTAHNMGGRLFIVIEGLAALNKPSIAESEQPTPVRRRKKGDPERNTHSPQMLFRAGDVFGDLELAAGGRVDERPTYYRQAIYAAIADDSKETVVLEVPAKVARDLMLIGQGQLAHELFAQLRIRLQSQIWLNGARSIFLPPESCDVKTFPVWGCDIDPKHLEGVHFLACTLLAAWDKQRAELSRPTPAVNTILLRSLEDGLAQVGHVEYGTRLEVLRMLVDAGVVVGWPIDGEFRKLLEEEKAPQSIRPLIVEPSKVSTSLRPLGELLSGVDKSTHFFVLEDLWLLRRLAAQPTDASFRLLAAASFYQRRRHGLGRLTLPTFKALANRYGKDVQRRYANLIIKLVDARVVANLASYDSLGIPL